MQIVPDSPAVAEYLALIQALADAKVATLADVLEWSEIPPAVGLWELAALAVGAISVSQQIIAQEDHPLVSLLMMLQMILVGIRLKEKGVV